MSEREYITEADVDLRETYFGEPVTDDDLMDYDEWWSEFFANACCSDSYTSALRDCGCGGTPIPSGISRLLELPEPDGDDFPVYDDDDGYGPYGRDCD